MNYTREQKRQAVNKLLRGGTSAQDVAKEVGIHLGTLYNWRRALGHGPVKRKGKGPRQWTPEERFQAVLEARSKSEDELGRWLREKGLTSEHLKQWEKDISATLGSFERSHDDAKNKELKALKKELDRKDKALAEVSALLVLKKKYHELLESEDSEQ